MQYFTVIQRNYTIFYRERINERKSRDVMRRPTVVFLFRKFVWVYKSSSRKQRQENCCKFKASLVYLIGFRPVTTMKVRHDGFLKDP